MPQEKLKEFLISLATNKGKIVKAYNKIAVNYDLTLADYLGMDKITELRIEFDNLYHSMYLEDDNNSADNSISSKDNSLYDNDEDDDINAMHEILASSIKDVIIEDTLIRKIDLSGYNIADIVSDDVLKQIALALENNNSLEELELLARKGFSDEGIKNLSKVLEQNAALKKLQLDSRFIDKGGIILARGLRKNKALEELSISWRDVEVSEEYIKDFCNYLGKNTGLKKLSLIDYYLIESLFGLIKNLNKLTKISHIEVLECDLDEVHTVRILHLLKQHYKVGIRNIKHLTIRLDESIDIVPILKALRQNEGLDSFEIHISSSSGTQLNNKLLLELANVINNNKGLQKLSLIVDNHNDYGVEIHDGISRILKALVSSSTLKEFSFDGVGLKKQKWLEKRLKSFIEGFKTDNKVLLRIEFPKTWQIVEKKELDIALARNIILLLTESWPKELSVELLEYLSKMEYNFNNFIEEGWNLLHYAAYNDDIEAVSYLLENTNCNKEAKNDDQRTVLSIAAQYAGTQIISLLMLYNCDVLGGTSGKDHDITPLQYAINGKKWQNIEMLYPLTSELLKYGDRCLIDKKLLKLTANNDDHNSLNALISKGAIFRWVDFEDDIDILSAEVKTLLTDHKNKELELVDLVQKKKQGFDTEQAIFDKVKYEIENGVNFNLVDENGESLLGYALKFKQLKLSSYLILKGAYYNPGLFAFYLNNEEQNDVGKHVMQELVGNSKSIILHLQSRTLITNTFGDERDLNLEKIYSDLYGLNSEDNLVPIKYFRPILDALFYSDIRIIFDQNNNHVKRIAIDTSDSTKGQCDYTNGVICIGGKIDTKRPYNELLGTIIHEFTHQLCQHVWKNHCKPFEGKGPATEKSSEEEDFIDKILNVIEKNHKSMHEILYLVFGYKKYEWTAEIIVRIPHIMAIYYFGEVGDFGRNSQKTIEKIEAEILKDGVELLHNYFIDIFIPRINKYILDREIYSSTNSARLLKHAILEHNPNQIIHVIQGYNNQNEETLAAVKIQKIYRSKMAKELKLNMKIIAKEEFLLMSLLDSNKFIHAHNGIWQDIHRKLEPIHNQNFPFFMLLKSREIKQVLEVNLELENQVIEEINDKSEDVVHKGVLLNRDRHLLIDPWVSYKNQAIDSILKLRLDSVSLEKGLDIVLIPSVTLKKLIKESVNIFDKAVIDQSKTILVPISIPQNAFVSHWIGIALTKRDNTLVFTYLDSENQEMSVILKNVLKIKSQILFPNLEIFFDKLQLEIQKYDNCGPEVVENFMYYLTGIRATQETTIYLHSILYENSLLDPEISSAQIAENNRIIKILSNQVMPLYRFSMNTKERAHSEKTSSIVLLDKKVYLIERSLKSYIDQEISLRSNIVSTTNTPFLRLEDVSSTINSQQFDFYEYPQRAFASTQSFVKFLSNVASFGNKLTESFVYIVLRNNYLKYPLLNYIYHEKLIPINQLLAKEYVKSNSANGMQVILQKHPYEWDKQDFRKIKLIVHPDKGGSAEDFRTLNDFETRMKNTDKIYENLLSKLSEEFPSFIRKINLYAKEVDVVTDLAKLYMKPSTEHAISTAYDSLMLCNKFYTDSKLGYFIPTAASVHILSNLYNGEYLKAGVVAVHSYSHYLLNSNLIPGYGSSVLLGLNGLTVIYDLYNGKYTAATFQTVAVASMYFVPSITAPLYALYYTGQNLYSLIQVYQGVQQQNILDFSNLINNLWKENASTITTRLLEMNIKQDDFDKDPAYYWNLAYKKHIEEVLSTLTIDDEFLGNEIIDNLAQAKSYIVPDSVIINRSIHYKIVPSSDINTNNIIDYLGSLFRAENKNLDLIFKSKFVNVERGTNIIQFMSVSLTNCKIHGYMLDDNNDAIQYEYVESTNSELCGSMIYAE